MALGAVEDLGWVAVMGKTVRGDVATCEWQLGDEVWYQSEAGFELKSVRGVAVPPQWTPAGLAHQLEPAAVRRTALENRLDVQLTILQLSISVRRAASPFPSPCRIGRRVGYRRSGMTQRGSRSPAA